MRRRRKRRYGRKKSRFTRTMKSARRYLIGDRF